MKYCKLITVWIQRQGCETEPHELLIAVDEETFDIGGKSIDDLANEILKLWKLTRENLSFYKVITIRVPADDLQAALCDPTVDAEIVTTD